VDLHKELAGFVAAHEWPIFPLVMSAPDFGPAMSALIQSNGIGPVRPNTVVLNWFNKAGDSIPSVNRYQFMQHLRTLYRFGMNIVALQMNPDKWEKVQQSPAEERRIDVWWQNDPTSQLMLLFAYLMTRNKPWNQATIRVLKAGSLDNLAAEKEALSKVLDDARIEAEPFIVESFDPAAVEKYSCEASLVFLPFSLKTNQQLDVSAKPFKSVLARLPITALVLAAEEIDLDAEPEDGANALIAEATDALEAARERMEKAEKRAAHARTTVEKLNDQITTLAESKSDVIPSDKHEELTKQVAEAQIEADKALRQAAKAKAKSRDAEKETEDIINELNVTLPVTPEIKPKDKSK
jgi:hypothetical protein